MALKRILLGTTAALGLAGLSAAQVEAAEVTPIGALDINLGGFARSYAFIGDLEEKTQVDSDGSYDFRTDTEVFVYVRGTDEATGLRYGANVELEADTNTDAAADEMFTFVSGTFGEVRFGDDDGAADNLKIGAYTIAAFSGGLDGVGPIDLGAVVDGPDSGDDTKILYYSPSIAGFQLGVGFTPHVGDSGTSIGSTDTGDVDDLVEGGVAYKGAFGDVGLLGSVIGSYGHFNDSGDGGGTDDFYKVYGGLSLTAFGIKLGGGWGYVQGGTPGDGGTAAFDRGSDYSWYNVGAAATFGPANLSVNWGHVYNSDPEDGGDDGTDDSNDPKPRELVFGVDVGVAPGLVVGGEVAFFDLDEGDEEDDDGGGGPDDDGVLGLVGIRVAF